MTAGAALQPIEHLSGEIKSLLPYMTPYERERFEEIASLVILEGDWRRWVPTMFPKYVPGEFADFQAHAWQWFWDIESGKRMEGLLMIISRFFAKSTSMQMGLTSCGARGTRRYGWYVSNTQKQADDHVQTIGSLLGNSNLGDYYPEISRRKIGKHGNAAGWRRNRFWTEDGFVVDAIGLDTASRGVKLEEQRPDIMVFDDVDEQHESPHVTAKKAAIITNDIMPAGDPKTCVYAFSQNLIHKDGVFAQIEDGRLKILKNRRFFGIVPAVKNLEWERDEDGYGVITGGEPTWDYMDLEKLQEIVNDITIESFLVECQHEVDLPAPGAIFGAWNEAVHVVTDSEFAVGWQKLTGEELGWTSDGRVKMPYLFQIARYQDVGTTKEHPTVTSWWCRPPEISEMHDYVFTHREMVFPAEWWSDKPTFDPFSVGQIAQSIYDVEMVAAERHRISDGDCFISHEGSSEVNTYDLDVAPHLRISWNKWKGDFREMRGVGVMNNFLAINRLKPHPFRRYPEGHILEGQPILGCPRMMLIVKDGQGELYMDEATGRLRVKPAVDAAGLRRARWEIPKYRLPTKATGEEHDVPKRINDDWVSTAKAAAANLFPQPKRMTKEQRAAADLAKVAPEYTEEAIEARPVEDRQGAKFRRDVILSEIRHKQAPSKPTSKLASLRDLRRGK